MGGWQGQSHPLMVVFRNFALDGASLDNVQANYDPSKGNILYFNVKTSYSQKEFAGQDPSENFHVWTSQFSQDSIIDTIK